MTIVDQIFLPLNNALAVVFGPLNIFPPIISVLALSSFLTILVIVITKLIVNTKLLREIKDEMEKVREELTKAQKSGDKELANTHLQKMMEVNSRYMQHSFKAVIVSIVVLGLFLPYLNFKYQGLMVAKLPFDVPFIGTTMSWLVWYVLVSFTIGWVVRKMAGIDYA